mmetsp:Transcript_93378/g.261171  ORF Transcript_93378/g.261171 Transcript_93378/m.261171 type:complete len:234 (-) Transcript_93378:100-801(-)
MGACKGRAHVRGPHGGGQSPRRALERHREGCPCLRRRGHVPRREAGRAHELGRRSPRGSPGGPRARRPLQRRSGALEGRAQERRQQGGARCSGERLGGRGAGHPSTRRQGHREGRRQERRPCGGGRRFVRGPEGCRRRRPPERRPSHRGNRERGGGLQRCARGPRRGVGGWRGAGPHGSRRGGQERCQEQRYSHAVEGRRGAAVIRWRPIDFSDEGGASRRGSGEGCGAAMFR